MARISNTTSDKKPLNAADASSELTSQTTPLIMAGMEDKWKNRAGEELEDTDDPASEETRLASDFAHDHGGFDDALD